MHPDYFLLPVALIILIAAAISMEKRGDSKTNSWMHTFSCWTAIIIAIWLLAWWGFHYVYNNNYISTWLRPNEFGDMFGALTCLFSGIAIAGVIAMLRQQHEEMKETRNEFAAHTKQFQEQTEQVQAQTKLLQKQLIESKAAVKKQEQQNKDQLLEHKKAAFEQRIYNRVDFIYRELNRISDTNWKIKIYGEDSDTDKTELDLILLGTCVKTVHQIYLFFIGQAQKESILEYLEPFTIGRRFATPIFIHFYNVTRMISGSNIISPREKQEHTALVISLLSFPFKNAFKFFCEDEKLQRQNSWAKKWGDRRKNLTTLTDNIKSLFIKKEEHIDEFMLNHAATVFLDHVKENIAANYQSAEKFVNELKRPVF